LLQSHKPEISQSIGSGLMRPQYGSSGALAARILVSFVQKWYQRETPLS
jgi:hypothetical protein